MENDITEIMELVEIKKHLKIMADKYGVTDVAPQAPPSLLLGTIEPLLLPAPQEEKQQSPQEQQVPPMLNYAAPAPDHEPLSPLTPLSPQSDSTVDYSHLLYNDSDSANTSPPLTPPRRSRHIDLTDLTPPPIEQQPRAQVPQ